LQQLLLPLREGGLGLSSVNRAAVAAQAASWHDCLPIVLAAQDLPHLEALSEVCLTLRPQLTAYHRAVGQALELEGAFTLPLPEHISLTQRSLTQQQLQTDLAAWRRQPERTDVAKAWALSVAGPGASSWLSPPTKASHHFNDEDFGNLIRLRLHLPVLTADHAHRHLTTGCATQPDVEGIHVISCPHNGTRVRRHNSYAAHLAHLIASSGSPDVRVEVPIPGRPPNERMDITHLNQRGQRCYLDVTIASPATTSALARGAATVAGRAARHAEQQKRAHYQAEPPIQHFCPFAVEAGGRLGTSAIAMLQETCPFTDGKPRASWMAATLQDLGCALQRSHAEALRRATTIASGSDSQLATEGGDHSMNYGSAGTVAQDAVT
jgi:hypothetical protein